MLPSTGTQASYDTEAAGLDIMAWLVKPPKPTELHDALAKAVAQSYRPAPVVSETEPDSLNAAIAALGAADRKFRALIVEDNATNKEVARWHLERLGFAADAVDSGSEAPAALERIPYDVVLMDCRMPKLDGYETTRRIRRREGTARHTKIVAMTAHALIGDREKCLAAGMDDYVSKPIEMNSLIAALSRVLDPGTAAARMAERAPTPARIGS
jgi:two-component system, sensor histidine kinase and response regulator